MLRYKEPVYANGLGYGSVTSQRRTVFSRLKLGKNGQAEAMGYSHCCE